MALFGSAATSHKYVVLMLIHALQFFLKPCCTPSVFCFLLVCGHFWVFNRLKRQPGVKWSNTCLKFVLQILARIFLVALDGVCRCSLRSLFERDHEERDICYTSRLLHLHWTILATVFPSVLFTPSCFGDLFLYFVPFLFAGCA